MTRNRPINEHIAYLLARATRQVHQQLDEEFRSEGVPVEQWRILKLLVEKNGRPMSDLTQAALLNHPTLTKMIDRMVSDALVYRRPARPGGSCRRLSARLSFACRQTRNPALALRFRAY